jgi:predicted TPR repeat methyltransferase
VIGIAPRNSTRERYSSDNLSYWTPIVLRLGCIGDNDRVLDLGCATGGFTSSIA